MDTHGIFWMLLPALLLAGGCGRREGEIIIEEVPPSVAWATTSRPPEPALTPEPPETFPEEPPAAPASIEPLRPRRYDLAIQVEWDEAFIPLLEVDVSSRARGFRVTDAISEDGAGIHGNLRDLPPATYLVRITQPLLPNLPLMEKSIDLDSNRVEVLQPRSVRFEIKEERSYEVSEQIEVALFEEPSRKPVYRAPLRDIRVHGIDGREHPRMILLPRGEYSYTLADIGKDPTIGFEGMPDVKEPVMKKNTFTVELSTGGSVVNLGSLIRTKAFREAGSPRAGSSNPLDRR